MNLIRAHEMMRILETMTQDNLPDVMPQLQNFETNRALQIPKRRPVPP